MAKSQSRSKLYAKLSKELRATRSARIYKRIATPTENDISNMLNRSAGRDSDIVDEAIRIVDNEFPETFISYIIFSKEKPVPFIDSDGYKDLIHGLFVLIEARNYALILNSKSVIPTRDVAQFFKAVDSIAMMNAKMSGSINLQKIRTKAMINTFDGCHNRTFEGVNLQTNLGSLSNHRQMVTSTTLRKGKKRTSIHFNLSKITDMGARIDIKELMRWANETINSFLSRNTSVEPFLLTYAQEVELPDKIRPVGILFHTWELFEYVDTDNGSLKLARMGSKTLTDVQREKIESLLSNHLELEDCGNNTFKVTTNLDSEVHRKTLGKIVIEDKKINLSFPILRAIIYEAEDATVTTFHDVIVKGGHFSVVFNDPHYHYSDCKTVRDADILNRAKMLTDILVPVDELDPDQFPVENGYSEDGVSYPENSLFCVIDDAYRYLDNNILICDDGGHKSAEWADFILFSLDINPEIVFFHAKSDDKIRRGATPFHVVAAQAIKNLGLITRNADEYIDRLNNFWTKKTRFGITRFRSDNHSQEQAVSIIQSTVENSKVRRKVVIFVNFLSKKEIVDSLAEPETLVDYQIQRIWLLNDFASSCWDLGLVPEIVCST